MNVWFPLLRARAAAFRRRTPPHDTAGGRPRRRAGRRRDGQASGVGMCGGGGGVKAVQRITYPRYFAGISDNSTYFTLEVNDKLEVQPFSYHLGRTLGESKFWHFTASAADIDIENDLLAIWNNFADRVQEMVGTIEVDLRVEKLIELELPAGHVFRRMARPSAQHPNDKPSVYPIGPREESELAQSLSELSLLLFRLAEVCRVVEPVGSNLETTGPAISETLVLACVAVENHMRLILERNNFLQDRYNTADFVKINLPWKLADYEIAFRDYPWLAESKPFAVWEPKAPTASLAWFDRYNQTKHNRYSMDKQPRLEDVFDATAALAILLIAQFGAQVLRRRSDVKDRISLCSFPSWEVGQLYIIPVEGKCEKLNFPFS